MPNVGVYATAHSSPEGQGVSDAAPTANASAAPPPRPWGLHREKVLSFESAKMEPLVALRNAIGVAAPLTIGVALGNPRAGVAASFGALQVSYSDSRGPHRQRARRMLTEAVLCSLAVVAGGMAMRSPVAAGALILVWGFVAGLVVCLGEAAENLGVLSLVTLIIYAVQPLTARQAMIGGVLAVGGGLLQTSLALLSWPIQRYGPERRELAALFLELSNAAITPAVSDSPPASKLITSTRHTIAGLSDDTSLQAERYWSLLNQAERIRLTLLALRRLRKRLEREWDAQSAFQAVDEFLSITARTLAAIGESILRRAAASSGRELLPKLETLADAVRQEQAKAATPFLAALENDARFQMDALTGQLHAAVRTTSESTTAQLEEFAMRDASRPWQARFLGSMAKLRANLTLQSSAFRHAVRLTVCLSIGEATAHLLHHPRSYWLAMTIVIVLKQEFAATFSRGVLRILGTIVGLVFATAMFHYLPHGIGLEVLLVGVMVFLLRWAGTANYGVFTIAMSALVVLLLAITGVPPMNLIFPRAEMTILGGVIALAMYIVWPTWERNQAPERLAQLLESYRRYFNALAEARSEGRIAGEAELGSLRMAARLARSNMEASYERLRAEPGTSPEEISLVAAILANSHRFVRSIMALEVVTPESASTRPEFRVFAADVDKTLDALIRVLHGEQSSPGKLPDLREDHHLLVNSAESDVSRHGLINEETDRMTNSVNTLAEQIALWQCHGRKSSRSRQLRRS